jgi:Kef-type K+ transport system membrane component KefB
LRQMKLMGRRIADLALGIAAVNDVLLWFMLGILLMSNAARSDFGLSFVAKMLGTAAYGLVVLLVARYPLRRLPSLSSRERLSDEGLVVLCAIMIISATVTEALGLHFVLGAFVAGLIIPREIRDLAIERLEFMTISILMPFYFMGAGFKTSIAFDSPGFLGIVLLTTLAAITGKLGGTALAARFVGKPWPIALGLGALVQTKGLMEVIVLAILLDSKIISTNVYSALIVMALITTSLTTPLARAALARGSRTAARGSEPLERKGGVLIG